MKRTDFLRQLLAGSFLLFVPRTTTAASRTEIKLSSPYIAGFQYYQGTEIENKLQQNKLLTLKREPTNEYDKYAVEVYCHHTKLGYLPREENRVIARMMDQGIEVKARITKYNPDKSPYRRVKVVVFNEI